MTEIQTATSTQAAQSASETPQAQQLQGKKGKNSKAGDAEQFNQALTQVQMQSQAVAPQAGGAGAASSVALSDAGKTAEGQARTGRSALRETSAERSPTTQTQAASVNTGAAIAGLKPWDKDWVFQGDEAENTALQPLIPETKQPKAAKVSLVQVDPSGTNPLAQATSQSQQPQPVAVPGKAAGTQAAMAGQTALDGTARTTQAKTLSVTRGEAAAAQMGAAGSDVIGAAPNKKKVAAAGVSAGGPSQSDPLMEQLARLNGEIEGVEGQVADRGMAGKAPAAAGGYPALSGSEFVDTLSGVQNRSADGQFGQQPGGQGQGKGRPRADLKVIEGGAKGPSVLGDSFGAPKAKGLQARKGAEELAMGSGTLGALATPEREQRTVGPALVTGHVVQGSMAKDRFSSESLLGMSTQIRNLSTAGGGEMRVRLKPDNLGELHVRVITNGRDVGLKIQASDARAKKVLEDSMSYLRDSLATQNLSLAKIDVSVGAPGNANSGNMDGNDRGQQGQGMSQFNSFSGQNAHQGGNGRGYGLASDDAGWGPSQQGNRSSGGSNVFVPSVTSRLNAAADGRLDVMA